MSLDKIGGDFVSATGTTEPHRITGEPGVEKSEALMRVLENHVLGKNGDVLF